MKRLLASLAAFAFILVAFRAAAAEPFGRLSVDEVATKIGKPGVHIYDNNPQEKFADGHVPSAKWLDYDQVKASELPADKTATLIFYCANER